MGGRSFEDVERPILSEEEGLVDACFILRYLSNVYAKSCCSRILAEVRSHIPIPINFLDMSKHETALRELEAMSNYLQHASNSFDSSKILPDCHLRNWVSYTDSDIRRLVPRREVFEPAWWELEQTRRAALDKLEEFTEEHSTAKPGERLGLATESSGPLLEDGSGGHQLFVRLTDSFWSSVEGEDTYMCTNDQGRTMIKAVGQQFHIHWKRHTTDSRAAWKAFQASRMDSENRSLIGHTVVTKFDSASEIATFRVGDSQVIIKQPGTEQTLHIINSYDDMSVDHSAFPSLLKDAITANDKLLQAVKLAASTASDHGGSEAVHAA